MHELHGSSAHWLTNSLAARVVVCLPMPYQAFFNLPSQSRDSMSTALHSLQSQGPSKDYAFVHLVTHTLMPSTRINSAPVSRPVSVNRFCDKRCVVQRVCHCIEHSAQRKTPLPAHTMSACLMAPQCADEFIVRPLEPSLLCMRLSVQHATDKTHQAMTNSTHALSLTASDALSIRPTSRLRLCMC
jgi:hypothetical protein